MRQLDLFNDFHQPAPALATEPERMGELVAFPLSRHLLVQQIAGRMRAIRDDDEREIYLDRTLLAFYRSRRDDGLSVAQARTDLGSFEAAIRAEYARPTPPPARWRGRDATPILFPEKIHDRQTA
ncbi:DUF6074 family protein [Brucella pseudintermedia]|uniref:DUF6074 family protein n=1 Tax=Brucella pseudintermedia TaxID=370111 RepID=A0ABY5U7D0_9HYPH|nr:DUF6074 family protein [Brucella pseudintermedia]UWL59238.1 DUF6074 family protein [Brucella pseudintermedia]